MNVRFIDTSVMMNLLEVPGRCTDSDMIKEEFRQVIETNLIGQFIMARAVGKIMVDRKIKQHPKKRQMRCKNKVKNSQPFSGQVDHMADIQKTDQNHADGKYDINRHNRLLHKNVHFILT